MASRSSHSIMAGGTRMVLARRTRTATTCGHSWTRIQVPASVLAVGLSGLRGIVAMIGRENMKDRPLAKALLLSLRNLRDDLVEVLTGGQLSRLVSINEGYEKARNEARAEAEIAATKLRLIAQEKYELEGKLHESVQSEALR